MKRIVLLAAALISIGQTSDAFVCQRYEYAEVKDMTKDELVKNYTLATDSYYRLSDPKYLSTYGMKLIGEQSNCLDATRQYESVLTKFHKMKQQALTDIAAPIKKKYETAQSSNAVKQPVTKTKRCPSCNKIVKTEATVCGNCQHEFEGVK